MIERHEASESKAKRKTASSVQEEAVSLSRVVIVLISQNVLPELAPSRCFGVAEVS